jgi:hypothetical protein
MKITQLEIRVVSWLQTIANNSLFSNMYLRSYCMSSSGDLLKECILLPFIYYLLEKCAEYQHHVPLRIILMLFFNQ